MQLENAPSLYRASYCEIYNEALYDLVKFTGAQLHVRWDTEHGFHVPDLFRKDCDSLADMIKVRETWNVDGL